MRNNLSVAIVAMVNSTGQDSDAQASADECGINATDTEEEETGDFNWSSYQQGLLLGAFYYGYTITQIPGGWLERKFGGMRVYGGSILLCAIFTMLTPAAAWLGFGAIFTCRFLLGFCQGWRVPWLAIVKSPQVWGLLIGTFCNNWGNYTLLTSLPQYMDQILGFNLGANGFMSSLSSLGIWTFTIFYGWLADYTRQRYIMSTIQVRRVLTSLGMFLPAIFLVVAGHIGCNRGLAVLFITISAAFSGCGTPGFKVNHVEIAPKFGGILFGITNTAGSISGALAPLVVGVATAEENTREQWQKIFGLSALIYVIGGIAVLLTLKVEEREWAKDKEAIQSDKTHQIDMDVYDKIGIENAVDVKEDDIAAFQKHQKHD
uniref:Vesicular glutamate transporter 2-like n=1 Tax=Saccoglossus kowalevskii TaxID=10224 RepID=A0ABM0M9D1_SACKO|nr:PREDICTED: vesicular glutamate transporter 2-like [Saccoglossus kowalevskii]